MAAIKAMTPRIMRATVRFEGRATEGGSASVLVTGVSGEPVSPFTSAGRTGTSSPQRGQGTRPAGCGSGTGTGALQYGQAIIGMAVLTRNSSPPAASGGPGKTLTLCLSSLLATRGRP